MLERWLNPILRTRPDLTTAALATLMIGIFIADTLTDLEVAVAVFYATVILAAVMFLSARGVIVLAGLCGILTVISFFLTSTGSREAGLLNASISLIAIGVTTVLSLKVVAAERAAREARSRLDRMAQVIGVAELGASIAHEVNQPLAAIVTSGNAGLRWLNQQPPNIPKAHGSLERIVADANRASEIIARVRGLAQGEQPRRDLVDLNEVVLEAVETAHDDIALNGIVLKTDVAETPVVVADRVQLQQVIANLILNAIDAMEKVAWQERTLTITTARDKDTSEAVVTVSDTGNGIATDAAKHVFDAFWTTKATGVGIGLTVSRSIVEANGGQLTLVSKQGRGACFELRLPAAKKISP